MIKNFSCNLTEDLFYDGGKKIGKTLNVQHAYRQLDRLDNASEIESLNFEFLDFKKHGNCYSIKVEQDYRLCFEFIALNAFNVAIKKEC